MKLVFITGKAICPYCGYVNKVGYSPKNFLSREIIYCDSEEGGCDKPFAVFNQTPRFETKVHKIALDEIPEEVISGKPLADIIPDETEPPAETNEVLTLSDIPEEETGGIIKTVKLPKKSNLKK
jgi:hypothetical protein